MERTASIPAWVARRGWNRRNPLWVRLWLDRKPKAGGSEPQPSETRASTATILPFSRDKDRA